MVLNGNKVIVFGLAVDGVLKTTFVPAGNAPAGSDYEEVYNRAAAIEYTIEEVLKKASGATDIQKILEKEEIIEQYDEGDYVG